MTDPTVTRWPGDEPPSQSDLEAVFHREELSPRWWSNAPGDVYGAHSHSYHKVLYCARGSIRFHLPDTGRDIDLSPGDRLDLPPETTHAATVGPRGVTCVEASRS